MKYVFLFFLVVALTNNAYAQSITGEYESDIGIMDVKEISLKTEAGEQVYALRFAIQAANGGHPCNIGKTERDSQEAIAIRSGVGRYICVYDDQCLLVLKVEGKALIVSGISGCDRYCGIRASGAYNGKYIKKSNKMTIRAF